jgi:outer membrane receptor protein involved in Fe transport
MLYATWSEGYRPGGINRNPFAGTYIRDILTNYELGWKTRFADDRVQLNGAVFLEDWDDIQVAFQGGNGITQVANGGKAEVKGIEAQLDWLPTDNLRLGLALAYYDTQLKKDFCDQDSSDGDDDGNITECLVDADTGETIIRAPTGTPLPLTPDSRPTWWRATPSRWAPGSPTCRAHSRTRPMRLRSSTSSTMPPMATSHRPRM